MSNNKEFVRSIENATLKIVTKVAINMNKACLVIERDAKINCPVDQGPLRASIEHSVEFNDKEIVGTVYSQLEYAPYVHQGTGIYAVNGDGRKTPWNWGTEGSKKWSGAKGYVGQKPYPFLEYAKLFNKDKISKILAR